MTKEIGIQDITPGMVNGVDVALPGNVNYREDYFEWKEAPLSTRFETKVISGGTLKCWHSIPSFREAENHVDAEMFYFIKGIAIMLFLDYKDGAPDPDTAQVVRIQPGTCIVIHKGKGHFVPVAEDDTPIEIVVVAT
jgi:oxalate decarboxylase/phosphoglucose isomerase-like protein (cupin superfamily)